jgi:phosphatidate cytidylyltransferase
LLRYRLLVGTILIAAFAGLCWLDFHNIAGAPSGAWLFPLALILSLLASDEMLLLTERATPAKLIVRAGNATIVAANALWIFALGTRISPVSNMIGPFGWPAVAFALFTMIAFVWEMWRYEAPGESITRLSVTILCLTYVGWFLTFLVQLSALRGILSLISLIAVVKMGDTGAYTIGRMIGRHKMTPTLSPGKTWEGAAGAMLFAVIGSWAVFTLLRPALIGGTGIDAWRWILFGLIVGIAGMLGDLAESLLKRDAGRKDSSNWMPGLGGVLDVLDSILLAAPVAYLCWAAGLVS